ncbi:hypothetical protein C8J57DRAFT_1228135 [Mycena rebaudengoi]|nr:hypothetical protein C8J57DRAFT_1228135 [Mycena rebaudengoi]
MPPLVYYVVIYLPSSAQVYTRVVSVPYDGGRSVSTQPVVFLFNSNPDFWFQVTPINGNCNQVSTVLVEFATIVWEHRAVLDDRSRLLGKFRVVYTATVRSLQPDPTLPPDKNNSTLRLTCPGDEERDTFLEEYTDTSPLDGLATFGGLWTTMNGIFVLFFGASIIYFPFGRRPLSALGLAGIVAFIHECLVDLDEDVTGREKFRDSQLASSEQLLADNEEKHDKKWWNWTR